MSVIDTVATEGYTDIINILALDWCLLQKVYGHEVYSFPLNSFQVLLSPELLVQSAKLNPIIITIEMILPIQPPRGGLEGLAT